MEDKLRIFSVAGGVEGVFEKVKRLGPLSVVPESAGKDQCAASEGLAGW
jgi:hypothetical protein